MSIDWTSLRSPADWTAAAETLIRDAARAIQDKDRAAVDCVSRDIMRFTTDANAANYPREVGRALSETHTHLTDFAIGESLDSIGSRTKALKEAADRVREVAERTRGRAALLSLKPIEESIADAQTIADQVKAIRKAAKADDPDPAAIASGADTVITSAQRIINRLTDLAHSA